MKYFIFLILLFASCSGDNKYIVSDNCEEITNGMFAYDEEIKEVYIPSSVTKIGNHAFANCINLKEIYIPQSVERISNSAFIGCPNIAKIVVDKDNPVFDSRNDCNAIIDTKNNSIVLGCKNTSIPNNVYSLNECSFANCINLKEIYIPQSVERISNSAFIGCPNIAKIVVDKDNPVFDSRNDCNAIIDTKNNSIVLGCKNTNIPIGVKEVGINAFNGSSIKSINIPSSINKIERQAFSNCRLLESIIFPNSLTYLGSYAFNNCVSLKEIVIPEKLQSIKFYPFIDCTSLETIIVDEKNSFYDSRNNCNAIIDTHKNRVIANCKNSIIPEGIEDIENGSTDKIENRELAEYHLFFTDSTKNNISSIFVSFDKELYPSYKPATKEVLGFDIYPKEDSITYKIQPIINKLIIEHISPNNLFNKNGEPIIRFINFEIRPYSGDVYLNFFYLNKDAYDIDIEEELYSLAKALNRDLKIPAKTKSGIDEDCFIRFFTIPGIKHR